LYADTPSNIPCAGSAVHFLRNVGRKTLSCQSKWIPIAIRHPSPQPATRRCHCAPVNLRPELVHHALKRREVGRTDGSIRNTPCPSIRSFDVVYPVASENIVSAPARMRESESQSCRGSYNFSRTISPSRNRDRLIKPLPRRLPSVPAPPPAVYRLATVEDGLFFLPRPIPAIR
jgi:hypothetical protein